MFDERRILMDLPRGIRKEVVHFIGAGVIEKVRHLAAQDTLPRGIPCCAGYRAACGDTWPRCADTGGDRARIISGRADLVRHPAKARRKRTGGTSHARCNATPHIRAQVPYFRGKDPGFITRVVMCLRPEVADAGDYIIREGELGHEMFIVTVPYATHGMGLGSALPHLHPPGLASPLSSARASWSTRCSAVRCNREYRLRCIQRTTWHATWPAMDDGAARSRPGLITGGER